MRTITDTTLFDFTDEVTEWDGVFEVVECRRALSPSGLPDMDYALNPYGGCEHGCIYCYGPSTTHTDLGTWRVVRVKRNIAERLAKELPSVEGIIGIGTVTDPYQMAEGRFRLTRRCLEILQDRGRRIHMHTKSSLVLRDIDLLTEIEGVVGITITTSDDRISRMTEPGAPLPDERLRALRELTEAGVDTYALIAPVMSTLEGLEEELMAAVRDSGTRKVYINSLHVRNIDTTRLDRMGITDSPDCEARLMSLGRSMGLEIHDVFR